MRERLGRERDGMVPLYFVLSPTMTRAGIQSLVRPAFPNAGVQCHLEGGLSGLRVGGERKRVEGQRWAPLVENKTSCARAVTARYLSTMVAKMSYQSQCFK